MARAGQWRWAHYELQNDRGDGIVIVTLTLATGPCRNVCVGDVPFMKFWVMAMSSGIP